MLFLLFLLTVAHAAWVEYYSFSGYIPSYTYPLTLQAGDVINGTCSWPGGEDLDIYLYSNGMDLLNRNIRVTREYSSSANPEILLYTIATAGQYFLRIDLFSTTPTPYLFEITINGVPISSFYDTVYVVSKGRTAKQFSISNTCTIQVQYEGPIYPLYLYAPGVNVETGTKTASNSSNVNPKILSANLSSPGTWTLIVHHSLASSTLLTPFSIVVYTDDANPCVNLCTAIPYAVSLYPGRTDICICEDGFDWNSGSQLCVIDCPSFPGTSTATSTTACSCADPTESWDSSTLACLFDCSLVSYASGPDPSSPLDTCLCDTGFDWDAANSRCQIDCSSIAYAVASSGVDQCTCDALFVWTTASKLCELDCGSIADTAGDLDPIIDQCACVPGFAWSTSNQQCESDCSMVAYSTGSLASGSSS